MQSLVIVQNTTFLVVFRCAKMASLAIFIPWWILQSEPTDNWALLRVWSVLSCVFHFRINKSILYYDALYYGAVGIKLK